MQLTALFDVQHLFPKVHGVGWERPLGRRSGGVPPCAPGGVLLMEPDGRMRSRRWGAGGATLDRGDGSLPQKLPIA
jgi:hypothetical protein